MIQITPQMKLYVAVHPVDFRKGIDGLCRLCRLELKFDPFTGAVFVFKNKRSTAIKLLVYDGQGFWLCQKRLSNGRFTWWPDDAKAISTLAVHELQMLIWNGNPDAARTAPMWKKIN
jgi:transposase